MSRITQKSEAVKLGICVFSFVSILCLWLAGIYLSRLQTIQNIKVQPFNEIFTSLNALFAGLAFFGLIVTIWIQYENLKMSLVELRKSSEANLAMVSEVKDNATLDLFQIYCSEYFQSVKSASHRVLIACVRNKKYCDFVISRFFVVGQLSLTEEIVTNIANDFSTTQCHNFKAFLASEQSDRYKLDELINFFTMLANRNTNKQIVENCDFFYSWWRPLFWMVATLQQERYESSPEYKEFCTKPFLANVLIKLDELYSFKPFSDKSEMWAHFLNHPKVRSYGIDHSFTDLTLAKEQMMPTTS